jgi:hydroxypyruvate reductase
MTQSRCAEALEIWQAGIRAVGGEESVAAALCDRSAPRPDLILAVGKAAVPMARAALARFPGTPALAVTKHGHADGAPRGLEVIEAGHPVPDGGSLRGGRRLLDLVSAAGPEARLLLLVSGGASALAEVPPPGWDLERLAQENRRLLASGLDIHAMNARRREISGIKGGRLLAAFGGAEATVMAISDVSGDDLNAIGSGIGAPPPAPGFACTTHIVASNAIARRAAAAEARRRGHTVHTDEEALYGDVAEVSDRLGKALSRAAPGVHLWGGEPTVVLPDTPGRGGRNQALALSLARHLAGRADATVLVAGTDGTDGPTSAAGGCVDGQSWDEAPALRALAAADSGTYLAGRDLLVETGPTGTNVMDLAVAIIG